MAELKESDENIVFIDELHTLVGAGSAEGTLDAANILKPALSRGDIQCIGATTPGEYRKTIEKDRALERRFQSVKIEPPTEAEALEIIEGIVERYEAFHQLRYSKDALAAAVTQSNRYIADRFLPDKAIDVLDEAGARAKLRYQNENRGEPSWKETVENWKRSRRQRRPVDLVRAAFAGRFVLRRRGHKGRRRRGHRPLDGRSRLIHQAKRSRKIIDHRDSPARTHRLAASGHFGSCPCDPPFACRPKESGPPRRFVPFLRPDRRRQDRGRTFDRRISFWLGKGPLIRFDMSEFMEKHSVSKFIGSPPGYVGHEEGGQLTEKLRRSPYAVVLFDEVEKAHPDLFNVLLQVFEDGVLTDSLGQAVDCKHAIFIMTSNLGARVIQKRSSLGFQSNPDTSRERVEEEVMSKVKQTFAPEFINRLDEIIIFDELLDEDLFRIVDLQIAKLNKIVENRELKIVLTDDARKWLIEKTCADRKYGARPLKRALQKYVEDELSEALIQGQVTDDSTVEVYAAGDKLAFREVRAKKAEKELTQKALRLSIVHSQFCIERAPPTAN